MTNCIVCGRRMPFEHDLFCSFGCKNKEEDKMSDNNAYIRYNGDGVGAEELFWESRKDCPPGHYRCPACEVVVPDKDAHPISAHPYAPAVCGQCAFGREVDNE